MAAINMNHQQFGSMMEEGILTLVNFWAPWCSYCSRIDRAYEKVAVQHADHMVVAKVNVDEEPHLAQKEQIEVLPTLVMYRSGEAIGSIVVPESKAMIDAFIQESLGNESDRREVHGMRQEYSAKIKNPFGEKVTETAPSP